MTDDPPYHDPDWLREQYRPEGKDKSAADIADEQGVSEETIRRWLHTHDIELKRGPGESPTTHKTIGLSPEVFVTHKERKEELGLTWDEYVDAEAPEWADFVEPEAIAEAVAERVDGGDVDIDLETAIEAAIEETAVDAVREAAYQGAREAVNEAAQGGLR